MSKCYIEPYVIPSAGMGEENPLPDIKNNAYIHAKIEVTDAIPEEDKRYIGEGMIPTLLPYREQNGYDRNRKDKVYRAVVLENKYLKAVILPELGGRLWSLWDKEKGRELLYRNPVFQPGNLALRNAWFSGGVEFNVSIKGHNPFTCDSIFARKLKMSDGSEGVRVYEYERIRGCAYGYDAWLPEDSKMLYIRPRIENRTGKEVWMYWWSNIAVPEVKKTRVVAPANDTFINFFGNNHYTLDKRKLPDGFDADVSYPANFGRSLDFFFDVPRSSKKWIVAVDDEGYGLLQCSTKELIGRKLFIWGQSGGGRNWNQFLSDGTNDGYVEIQAGLAHTQLEHIPMADGDTWSWVEGYGAISTDKEKIHGDWFGAIDEADASMEAIFENGMENTLEAAKLVTAEPQEFLNTGSGWGALENLRRAANGEISLSDYFEFPEFSMSEVQREWQLLLDTGAVLERDTTYAPEGYLVDAAWAEKLEKALEKSENRNWYSLMHLGVMKYANGDLNAAKKYFEESLGVKETAWVNRNLAMIWRNELGDAKKAVEYMEAAIKLNNTCRSIVLDTATTYLAAGEYQKWIDTYATLPVAMSEDGRIKLYLASALMKVDKFNEAAEILNPAFEMPDMKEADTDLSDLWITLYSHILSEKTGITDEKELAKMVETEYPLGKLDFRTH